MAIPTNYPLRVIARVGLATKVGASFITGEIAWARDTKTFYVGDDTATPPKLISTKSTDAFDFSKAQSIILPGGAKFDRDKPGMVDGVNIRQFNGGNGVVVRTADGKFANREVTSSDKSMIIEQARGVEGDINIRLNPESPVLKAISVTVVCQPLPPENPALGMLWLDTEETVLYIRVENATSAVWMSVT